MLEHEPEYQKLSDGEKLQIVRRMMKVYAAHRHPERGKAVQAEVKKIVAELRSASRRVQ